MMGMFFYSLLQLHPLQFLFLSIFLIYFLHVCFYKYLIKTINFSSKTPLTNYPLIGCLLSFYKNRHRLLDWYTQLLAESSTKTIVVQRLGSRRTVVTANPENIEYILSTRFNNFPKGKPFTEILGDFLGYGIFNVDGELWRTQRKLASHEFSARSLKDFVVRTLEEEVENHLLPLMESLAEKKTVLDLQELLRRLGFNVICKISLGTDRYCLDPSQPISPLAKGFDVASEISAKRATEPLFLVWKIKKWLKVGSERKLREAIKDVHRYVMEIIHNRKRNMVSEEEDQDLLSRLILAGHEDEVIRDMVINFIMAGRDTTSAAMTWFFWLISRHPDEEKEVVKEIEDSLNHERALEFETFKELKMLEACLCETMRVYPPVAWDSKHAISSDFLPDGTQILAGDRVTYFPYGMGRMEALWGKDRYEFKPKRWFLDEKRELKKVCAYKFPIFQAGPRVCLGKDMAFIHMKYVVASILRRFEIRPVGAAQPVFVPLLTAHMAGGLKVLIRGRTTSP